MPSRFNNAASPSLVIAQEIEGQTIASTLDTGTWTLQGRRNRIFVLVSGTGELAYEDETTAIAAPGLVWVPVGQPAQLTLFAGSRGAWLAISDAALDHLPLPANIAADLRSLARRPQLGVRIARDLAERLTGLMSLVEAELRENKAGAQELVRHQLAILAIVLWRIDELVVTAARPAPRALVNEFLHLVEQQMRRHWKVSDYARHLGVSVDRLTTAVQRAAARPPLVLIHARLFDEARQMIEASGLQISEIADSLGFDDPAYFSRFFKRMSGKSPRQYRLDYTQSQIRISGSFAAWP